MTNEQAIEKLEFLIVAYTPCGSGEGKKFYKELITACESSIKALEKQIPKKPKKILQAFEYRFGDCPSCNKSSDMNYKHCQYCGQKLDWE